MSLLHQLRGFDKTTFTHSKGVAIYSMMIGRSLGLQRDVMQTLYISALLHDIGKLFLPLNILNKKSALTTNEYKLVKNHPTLGVNYLRSTPNLSDIDIVEAVHFHHERVDGKGYPCGLKGDEIPLFSKVISVADTYDAMTTREYNTITSKIVARDEIYSGRGTQFDKEITDAFLDLCKSKRNE